MVMWQQNHKELESAAARIPRTMPQTRTSYACRGTSYACRGTIWPCTNCPGGRLPQLHFEMKNFVLLQREQPEYIHSHKPDWSKTSVVRPCIVDTATD
jgi:hypothetical protein